MWQIWLILAGVCLIIEIMTVGFLIFWFAIGSLLAMIVSFFTTNLIIQTSVFILSSTILIFVTKPFVQKFVNKIFKRETHLPSLEKLWQIPHKEVLPREPFLPSLLTPLDVQATSYFAADDNILSLSLISIKLTPNKNSIYMYYTPYFRQTQTFIWDFFIFQSNFRKNIC